MSEYQIVKFRAIDRPLTDKQLEFMDNQSSRAEFTKWEFDVEYHYSSFRGDVDGMLRNGYDIYLTYSNYGCREIRMRLPEGLPFLESLWPQYFTVDGFKYTPDEKGKAGILCVAPYLEDGFEPVWEFDAYLDATTKLRELLISGDLRALYVLWLCCAEDHQSDEAVMEPPVPHGLAAFPDCAKVLLSFFLIDPVLVDAAAVGIPAFNYQRVQADAVASWLAGLSESRRVEILRRLLAEDPLALKRELLSELRGSQEAFEWPVASPSRTIIQLTEECDRLRQKENEKQRRKAAAKAEREAEKAEKQRQAKFTEMRSTPELWLAKAAQLVEARGTDNYHEAASILSDLRDAIGGEKGNELARKHVSQIVKKHPTLTMFKSELRKQGLWG